MPRVRMWRCSLCGWLNPPDSKACIDCDKGKPRKCVRLPPSFRPWKCVVLAVDAGGRSGWAVWVLGKLADSGEFNMWPDEGVRELVRVVEIAKSFAAQLRVSWVVIIEEAWGGRMGVGLSGAGGAWKFAARNAQCSNARVRGVLPNVWRARTLPKGSNRLSREEVRPVELVAATEVAKREVGSDEAPAILLGKWGTQAGEVGEMLPKNVRVTV